jgi:LmbE family N-acetylglucosaminyl deacetylase
MSRISVFLLLLLSVSVPLSARTRPARAEPAPPPSGRLMFIGAHPDDEVLVAPLLAQFCGNGSTGCTIVSLTRGERGVCLLPGGCGDLAAIRIAELSRSAEILGARPIWFEFADGPAGDPIAVRQSWAAAHGSEQTLITMLAQLIEQQSPHSVITFDPRHGSTCHPDHRAIGSIAAAALRQLGSHAPEAFFLETRVHLSGDGRVRGFAPAVPPMHGFYEMNAISHWSSLLDSVRAHASQFPEATLQSLTTLPEDQRRVYLLSTRSVIRPEEQELCGP